MNVSFRVEASERVGLGHLSRCLRIASELSLRGTIVNFIMSEDSKPYASRIAAAGFECYFLPSQRLDAGLKVESIFSDQIQLDDADSFLAIISSLATDTVVVDHYGLDDTWESKVIADVGNLVVVDDLANRTHNCRLLLDYNLPIKDERYERLVPAGTRILSGLRYAPIGREYFVRRGDPFSAKGKVSTISVFMGGAAIFEALVITSRAALEVFHDLAEIRLVVPPNFMREGELFKEVGSSRLTIVPPVPSLVEEYKLADLVIGAAGVASLERLAFGMPSATLVTAENQIAGAVALQDATNLPFLDVRNSFNFADVRNFLVSIRRDFLWLEYQAFLSQFLIDKFGLERVLAELIDGKTEPLVLRSANISDCATYFLWVNDPQVREYSLNQNRISAATHFEWFSHALESKLTILYVADLWGLPIGQVRFTLLNSKWWLDYSIDVDFRGKGFAKQIVHQALSKLAVDMPHAAVGAVVKAQNGASRHVLDCCGFIEQVPRVKLENVLEFEWRGFGE
jgi:UDP-2,4-diacetamido-2,4,6-trideoxy-beta-L-altropyranose hydrolase